MNVIRVEQHIYHLTTELTFSGVLNVAVKLHTLYLTHVSLGVTCNATLLIQ